jgi:hypothetical protein
MTDPRPGSLPDRAGDTILVGQAFHNDIPSEAGLESPTY